MKKIILSIVALFLAMSTAFAVDVFTVYDFSFTYEKPSSIYLTGGVCADSGCKELLNGENTEFYSQEAISCWKGTGTNINEFNSCIAPHKIDNKILTNVDEKVLVKEKDGSFGARLYFYTSGDSYVTFTSNRGQMLCGGQACTSDLLFVDSEVFTIPFTKKTYEAVAEINELNIVNTEDREKPIQVTVPVEVEETICSAFQYTNPNIYIPDIGTVPSGYSDYHTNTEVTLYITDANTGESLISEPYVREVAIEADKCIGTAMFSWVPPEGFEDVLVKFEVTTEVIDDQVANPGTDYATATEMVYPIDLDGSCWTKTQNFALTNSPNEELSTSVAKITQGEYLYAVFEGLSLRDNAKTPIDFTVDFYFNENLESSYEYSSGSFFDYFTYDLSDTILGLEPGFYEVELVTTPVDNRTCQHIDSSSKVLNLQIMPPELYSANFTINDPNGVKLEGANIQLVLLDPSDYFQNEIVYDETLTTNTEGKTQFTDLYKGSYEYTVSKEGYVSVSKEVLINSDVQIYETLTYPSLLTVYS
jgi:hypothetical protein